MQVAEYNRLKTKAGKKSASLNQQLERVRDFTIYPTPYLGLRNSAKLSRYLQKITRKCPISPCYWECYWE